ncbi:lipocalin family protein [Alteromonas lipotrueiana]|uniref:lipocalin family protein n=1 Tax=Alteromonas lipotrueiana TaxID=2803815 RepID=UPI001C443BDC
MTNYGHRSVAGESHAYCSVYVAADGQATTLAESDLSIQVLGYERINKRKVPVEWQIEVAQPTLSLTVKPFKKGQWNASRFSYYEGRVEVSGSHHGDGFMELTGYQ